MHNMRKKLLDCQADAPSATFTIMSETDEAIVKASNAPNNNVSFVRCAGACLCALLWKAIQSVPSYRLLRCTQAGARRVVYQRHELGVWHVRACVSYVSALSQAIHQPNPDITLQQDCDVGLYTFVRSFSV